MTIDDYIHKIKAGFDFLTLPNFANDQKGLRIASPRRISNPSCISLGDNVRIGPNSVLAACVEFKRKSKAQSYSPSILIGSNVCATSSLQIYCANKIEIEEAVLIAANVFICDYAHGYSEVTTPFCDQPYTNIQPVRIGRGTWLGQNVVIMPGVHIGKQCVIGASSVVTHSIPDYSIAAGTPAKVIKSWDFESQAWVRPNTQNNK